jgi:hypothetical protein
MGGVDVQGTDEGGEGDKGTVGIGVGVGDVGVGAGVDRVDMGVGRIGKDGVGVGGIGMGVVLCGWYVRVRRGQGRCGSGQECGRRGGMDIGMGVGGMYVGGMDEAGRGWCGYMRGRCV